MMHDARRSIRQASRLIDFYADQAERAWLQRDGHAAAAWASIAAEHAFGLHPGYFASMRLEKLLLEVARTVPIVPLPPQWQVSSGDEPHILHVLTTAYAAGGHGHIVERWARSGAEQGQVHWAVLLNQGRQPVPPWLDETIAASGGRLIDLREPDLIQRAAVLRALWRDGATCVIDTTHPYDAVPLLAFGVEHGAPVYLMNAADHVFWLGVAIADVVIDIRASGQVCSQQRRSVRRSELLPIPLVEPSTNIDRVAARRALGMPDEACVLLTVASAYKYTPMPPWSFMQAVGAVMERRPQPHLVAAGPKDQPEWQPLRNRFPDRVHLLGEVADLQPLHAAADIYLDSFPFASLTATLEAGLAGLPLHLPFNPVAPLMSNGDPSLVDVPSYAELADYVDALVNLVGLPAQWTTIGQSIADRIRELHGGSAWMQRANEIIHSGGDHAIVLPNPPQAAEAADLRWVEFQTNVRFLPTMGVGLFGFKEFRRRLAYSGRIQSAVRLLVKYPRYVSRPRLAARVAYEIVRD
jgi:hypothetical protein